MEPQHIIGRNILFAGKGVTNFNKKFRNERIFGKTKCFEIRKSFDCRKGESGHTFELALKLD